MDRFEAENFLRKRVEEMAAHDDPTNEAISLVLETLDTLRKEDQAQVEDES